MAIEFQPLTTSDQDMALMHKWLQKPHISRYWDSSASLDEFKKKYQEKIDSDSDLPCFIKKDGQLIGYVQAYDAAKAGDGWWADQPPGTWGLDIFIGEEDYLGKGLGTLVIEQFADKIFKERQATKIIVDPEPDNIRMIQACEKAGFRAVGETETPDGRALLMEKLRT